MLKSGDKFGGYAVVRLLGKGGMGSVFLLQAADGRQVAAKILDPASSADAESRKRFLREAQLAFGVKHPNLVEVYDVGADPDTGLCYILMEYVPNGSLADYLKENGALPIEDALAIIERGGTFDAVDATSCRRDAIRAMRKRRRRVRRLLLTVALSFVALVGLVGIVGGLWLLTREETPSALAREESKPKPTVTEVKNASEPEIRMVVKTNVVEKIVEKNVIVTTKVDAETKVAGGVTVAGKTEVAEGPEKSQGWEPGPSEKWFVNWDEALADARDRNRPILALNTGSTWCHWCKKLRAEVLDTETFREFADANLTLLYLDSPCQNVDQRNHNKRIVKALKFGGGVPNARLFTGSGVFLGAVGGGALAADAYVRKLREVSGAEGEALQDDDGRMLFTEGYAALAAKIAENRAKLPKVEKKDFKAELVGVAVVERLHRGVGDPPEGFLAPESSVEVPFGKAALFKVEYDFPEGYEGRIWTYGSNPQDDRRTSSAFVGHPSKLYRGKGVAMGFLSLKGREPECALKSVLIWTASEPEIDEQTQHWQIGSFPVDVVFRAKDGGTDADAGNREKSTPPGWLDDLDAAMAQAKREKKLILAAFEGSDWCGWCKKMELDVYRNPAFMPTVTPRFVPVYIDKPRDRTLLREAVRERNPALHGEYAIRGVPCVVIMDADGKELGRVGGYKKDVGALMERINESVVVNNDAAAVFSDAEIAQMRKMSPNKAVQTAFERLFPKWKVTGNVAITQYRSDTSHVGYYKHYYGRGNVCKTLPRRGGDPVIISRSMVLPRGNPQLDLSVTCPGTGIDGGIVVCIIVNGLEVEKFEANVGTSWQWQDRSILLRKWAGRNVKIEIRQYPRASAIFWEACWARIEVRQRVDSDAAK